MSVEAERDRYREALERIEAWARAYPLSVTACAT
jgi:hypothetical protein